MCWHNILRMNFDNSPVENRIFITEDDITKNNSPQLVGHFIEY